MKKIFPFVFTLICAVASAQFVSPGTGVSYTLTSLSAAAPTVLVKTGSEYQLTSNLTITAGDELLIDENTVLKIDGGVQITIGGKYYTTATNFTITATDPAAVFKGIRLEEGSSLSFLNTKLQYGGGLQVLTADFTMDNCTVQYFKAGLVTGAAVNFSRGTPVVTNSRFIENDLPAVASGANQSVALQFINNYLQGNTKLNSNRPQINMGPSGSGITRVINNEVIGNRALTKVGGISVSTLLGGLNQLEIINNVVSDNRYGITVAGNNSSGIIANNILDNNNTEPVPANGGSGISLNGSGSTPMQIKIQNNMIRGHLWGITILGTANADLGGGPLGSVGGNIFANNGNGGNVYALYNNTALEIFAKGNCWREGELSTDAMVEEVIFHKADDATLGLVHYKPYICADVLATADGNRAKIAVYPNPSNGKFNFVTGEAGTVTITDASGKLVHTTAVTSGTNEISLKAAAGLYHVIYQSGTKKESRKIIIK